MRVVVLLSVFLGLAAAFVFSVLFTFRHFSVIERQFQGECTPVRGIPGPEDIRIGRGGARAFISSADRRDPGARGAIHIFSLDDPLNASGWKDQTIGAPTNFRPLGIDLYADNNVERLFAVNEANNSVEIFDITRGGVVHAESISDPLLTSPNSIAAVGPREFYITNDVKGGRNGWAADFNFMTRAKSGSVYFYDGQVMRLAAYGLRFANGIDLSPDGAAVYVAETAGNSLRLYSRDPVHNDLTPIDIIKLPASPDNITVDNTGVIWIGAMPKPLTLPAHARDASRNSPSAVLSIGPDRQPAFVYKDPGTELSASTAAVRFGKTLMIGGLYDEKFLICRLPSARN